MSGGWDDIQETFEEDDEIAQTFFRNNRHSLESFTLDFQGFDPNVLFPAPRNMPKLKLFNVGKQITCPKNLPSLETLKLVFHQAGRPERKYFLDELEFPKLNFILFWTLWFEAGQSVTFGEIFFRKNPELTQFVAYVGCGEFEGGYNQLTFRNDVASEKKKKGLVKLELDFSSSFGDYDVTIERMEFLRRVKIEKINRWVDIRRSILSFKNVENFTRLEIDRCKLTEVNVDQLMRLEILFITGGGEKRVPDFFSGFATLKRLEVGKGRGDTVICGFDVERFERCCSKIEKFVVKKVVFLVKQREPLSDESKNSVRVKTSSDVSKFLQNFLNVRINV